MLSEIFNVFTLSVFAVYKYNIFPPFAAEFICIYSF